METSTTITLFETPTWGAESPTPGAAHMVSAKSRMSPLISGVTSSTGLHRLLRMGSGCILISRFAI